ncbi:G-box-binding factor-like [Anopheles cruzii]|uniref:G-box-binding factor-like n=1 Tax=Anopheles cruzii TaxID=68878 RepID=UPI0022EC18FD|nr:G-box-binding factor-like [Anopheles cruzii]
MSRQASVPGPTTAPMPSTVATAYGGGVSLLDKLASSTVLQEARVYPVTVPGAIRLPAGNDGPFAVTPSTVLTTVVQTDDFVVHPGPEDVLLLNTTTGLYQQSVTLTARMYPIEATAAKSIWGLPTLIWAVLIGTIVVLLLILATLFFCCWLQPRTRKLLNSSYYTTTTSTGNASQSSIVTKSCTGSSDSNQLVMPLSIGICPPQYSAPPPPQQSQQQQQQGSQSHHGSSGAGGGSNSSLHHASHGPSAHHTCNASAVGNQQCSMASGGQDYGHVKYGSSPQQQQQQHYSQQPQQHQQQYAHHHHAQHHQHQCIHYQQQQQHQQQQYNQQLHQQQHAQQHHGHHVHGQQQYPYNQHQYYHHPAQHQHQQQQQQQQQQYLHYQQHQQQHHPQQLQQREHHHQHHSQPQQQQHRQSSSGHHQSPQSQLAHSQLHKSMWAINPLYASSGVINDDNEGDTSTSYRTRSLPSWGKNRQRPLSNADDLEELYAKVNFSKKRRNRMRNDEAAIIALCRSRSQNLAALPLATDQDAVVVYDERTAL